MFTFYLIGSLVSCSLLVAFSGYVLVPAIINWIYAKIDKHNCTTLGSQDASLYYIDKVHELLEYASVKNAAQVPVRKLSHSRGIVARSFSTGIWIDEDVFFKGELNGFQLRVLAREAIHYARRQSVRYKILNACAHAAIITIYAFSLARDVAQGNIEQFTFCTDHHYNVIINLFLNNAISLGLMFLWLNVIKKLVIRPYIRRREVAADIQAAVLLCQNGYSDAVGEWVKTLEEMVAQNVHNPVQEDHPTWKEQLSYMIIFWHSFQEALHQYSQAEQDTSDDDPVDHEDDDAS